MLSDEWETTRVIDFNQNFETISKRGKNIAGSWNESWFNNDQGQVKWARKEGENYFTKD